MKKLNLLLLTLMLFIPTVVFGASGTVKVTSATTIVKGNQVNVTVTLASPTPVIGSWEMRLDYDKSFLQLMSATSEGKGTVMANATTSAIKNKTYTFSFKTLKTGSTKISVGSYLVYEWADEKLMTITSTPKTINIITQEQLEASYSKNNNLKSLEVDGFKLDTEFNKNTLTYNVEVPEETKVVKINATAEDSKSTISGLGEKEVTLGLNTLKVLVTAQNGSEKEYTLLVNVIDKDPINVTISGKDYTLIKLKEQLPEKILFEESSIIINEFEIPTLYNELTNITLVGLKNSLGDIELFEYKNNTYHFYKELCFGNMYLIPQEKNIDLKGYKPYELDFINVYKYSKSSDYYLIYAINIENGKTDLYLIDELNNSAIIYNDEYIKDLENTNQLYIYLIAGFSLAIILQFLLIIKKKKVKEIKKEEVKKEKPVKEKKNNKNK